MSTNVEEKSKDKDDVFVIDDNDCDEDVPGDFFDDFLKEDFMAGLDIVDDDQWDNGANKRDKNGDSPKKIEEKNPENKSETKEVKDTGVNEKNKSRDSKKKKSRSERTSNKKEKRRGIDADEFDIRRDPNKTKRDIERDKAKCEKDKEKKIITEKLKLVETGLVPPGMEMEVDISEINKEKEGKRKSASRNSPVKRRRSRGKSGSPRRRSTPQKRSRTRLSPLTLRMSPRRSPRRSPLRRRSRERISRERRSRERSIERKLRSLRRSRSISPYRGRRAAFSPDYPRRRRRSRSRSRSRGRKNNEKKSFLQEIVEKLRESRPSGGMMPQNQYLGPPLHASSHIQSDPHIQPIPPLMPPGPPHLLSGSHVVPVPPSIPHVTTPVMPVQPPPIASMQPAPVPAPTFPVVQPPTGHSHQGHQKNQYDPYDQSFFIGNPQLNTHNQQSVQVSQQVQALHQKNINGPPPTSAMTNKNIDISPEEVGKLFHDKKITLSEFLAITAKPEVPSANPVQLKDKIKVLSRCHDAIKILESHEKKFQGRFQLRRVSKPQPTTEEKYKSPLVKSAETKISFTEIPSKEKNKSAFTIHLNNLLRDIGLLNEVVEVIDDPEPIISSFVPRGTSPPPAPNISRQKQNQKRYEEPPVRIYSDKHLTKMVQTDPVPKCIDCEKRKKILHKTTSSQTGEMMTYSVSTQVTEDELVQKIPKNQSLAALTPAQLLAQNAGSSSKRYNDNDDFDIYPSNVPFNRSGFDYARAAESFNSSSNTLRFLPPDRDRDRDESHSGGRGRGPPNTGFDIGPRYSYY